MKVLVVPTPPEIGDAYGVAAERRSASGAETWDEFVAASVPNSEPPKLSRASMIYTSGTTGRPKGVRRQPSTPELQAKVAEEVGKYWGLVADPSIVVMINGPMYHSAPAAYGMSSARLGLSIVLQPRFDAEDMLRLIDKHRVSYMLFVRLLRLPAEVKKKYDLSSLRWITHGAAPCAPAVKREMIDWWGPMINEYYGATETGIVVWLGRGTKEARHRGRRGRGRDHAYRRRARPRREARRGRRDLSARTAALRFHVQQRRRQAARDSAR
jgi:long-chain acyl-CoA synthetase